MEGKTQFCAFPQPHKGVCDVRGCLSLFFTANYSRGQDSIGCSVLGMRCYRNWLHKGCPKMLGIGPLLPPFLLIEENRTKQNNKALFRAYSQTHRAMLALRKCLPSSFVPACPRAAGLQFCTCVTQTRNWSHGECSDRKGAHSKISFSPTTGEIIGNLLPWSREIWRRDS